MALPRVQLDGRLTADPELRFTPGGFAVVNFTVAGNDRKKNDQSGEWEDGPTTFLRCSAWRDMAENVAESLAKGDAVLVTGKLTQREYEHEGQKRVAYEVSVDTIGPSLRWRKTPHGQKVERSQGGAEDPWATSPAQVPRATLAGPDERAQPILAPPPAPPQQSGWGGQPPQYDQPPF